MKTKNRYKHSKIVLFTGLLSFDALSSCVNTDGHLGINPKNKQSERGSLEKSLYYKISQLEERTKSTISNLPLYRSTPLYKKPKYVWGLGVGGQQ